MELSERGQALYYQIETYLKNKVLQGEWEVGMQIPTEPELIELFHVSRATLRHAVGNLCNEGLLERRQGRGTFVKNEKLFIEDYTKIWQERDARHYQETLSKRDVYGKEVEHICNLLALKADSILLEIKYRHLHQFDQKKEPGNVTFSYFSKDSFPGLEVFFNDEETVYQMLKKRYNVYLNNALTIFHAIDSEKDIANLLEIPDGTPVIHIEKVFYDISENPIYVSEMYLHPKNNRLEFHSKI